MLLACQWAMAQNRPVRDVVVLKDDRIYEGTILQMLADTVVVLRRTDSTVVRIPMYKVDHFEKTQLETTRENDVASTTLSQRRGRKIYEHNSWGFFGNVKININFAGGAGIGVVLGHKLNRFTHLGLGVGIEGRGYAVGYLPAWEDVDTRALSGGHVPVYVHLGGDVLTSYRTPFYILETGYVYQFGNNGTPLDKVASPHGLHVGSVIGYRFNSRRRYSICVGFRTDFDSYSVKHRVFTLDESTDLYHVRNTVTFTASVYCGLSVIHCF
jgi:hypothetical protein